MKNIYKIIEKNNNQILQCIFPSFFLEVPQKAIFWGDIYIYFFFFHFRVQFSIKRLVYTSNANFPMHIKQFI